MSDEPTDIQQADVQPQPADYVPLPPEYMAQQSISRIPPAIYERLNGAQMDKFLENLDKSDERWAGVKKHTNNASLISIVAILGALVWLLLAGKTEAYPVIKELLGHAITLVGGWLGGMGYARLQKQA